jgi:hypothetical protein
MLDDDPTFEAPTARFVPWREGRNLSENASRASNQDFRQFRRIANEQALTMTASPVTSDLVRRFHGWLKATPTARARFGGHERGPGGIANRLRCLRSAEAGAIDIPSYLLTEDATIFLAEDEQGLLITEPPTPLYASRGSLVDSFANVLAENRQQLLAEDGSASVTNKPPSPLTPKHGAPFR